MLFNNKQLNCMLNNLLKNNKYARENVVTFINALPEKVLEILHECRNTELIGEDWFLKTSFSPTAIQIDIYHKNSVLLVDFYPITAQEVKCIPQDEHNDIFFPDENYALKSPACFSIVYNANTENPGHCLDYDFVIVSKLNKNNQLEYYLSSQSNVDAGVYCSKIDIEDFIVTDYSKEPSDFCFDEEDFEEDDFHPHNSRRSPHPRLLY